MPKDHRLYQPFSLHDLKLPNRIALAPMTRARAGEERMPNALMGEYYAQRATAGLIITEATTISAQANGWVQSPGIYTDEMTDGWRQVVKTIHDAGGKVFLQLWHCGRASHSSFHNGDLPVAPSAIPISEGQVHTPNGKQDYETPRPLATDEVSQVVADYRHAAERAKSAGFDGVEIHAANGYLIDQFLQSKTNQRDDRYGGSVENRYRFLDEIVTAITEVWPANRVGVRLAPNGSFNDMGAQDYREQFTYAAKQLDRFGLCYLHLLDGLAFGFHELGEPMTLNEFRDLFSGPLIGNCGYDKEQAEIAIAAGHADMIAIGRPFISNPDLVKRYANDLELNPDADQSVWYSPTGAKGYTDFPMIND